MALQSSGAISLFDISNEFGGYAYPPVEIDDYMAADPVNQPSYGNAVGTAVDFADFYGTSIKTTRLQVQPNNDSYARWGYARSNGYFYYQSESGQSGTAFGTSTRNSSLAAGSRTLACIVVDDTGYYDYLTIGFSGGSSSTNGGWTTATFYDTSGSGPFPIDMSSGITLNRTDAINFGALPGTSPTVYGYRFGYWGASNTASINAANVSQLIKDNAVMTPYWVFVEFT